VKDDTSFEGLSCDTKIMFAKGSCFGGVYGSQVAFKSDDITTFVWKTLSHHAKKIIGELTVPATIVEVNVGVGGPDKEITVGDMSVTPEESFGNKCVRKVSIDT